MTTPKAIQIDHSKKTITVVRQLNPPSFHARMLNRAIKDNPSYEVIKLYEHP